MPRYLDENCKEIQSYKIHCENEFINLRKILFINNSFYGLFNKFKKNCGICLLSLSTNTIGDNNEKAENIKHVASNNYLILTKIIRSDDDIYNHLDGTIYNLFAISPDSSNNIRLIKMITNLDVNMGYKLSGKKFIYFAHLNTLTNPKASSLSQLIALGLNEHNELIEYPMFELSDQVNQDQNNNSCERETYQLGQGLVIIKNEEQPDILIINECQTNYWIYEITNWPPRLINKYQGKILSKFPFESIFFNQLTGNLLNNENHLAHMLCTDKVEEHKDYMVLSNKLSNKTPGRESIETILINEIQKLVFWSVDLKYEIEHLIIHDTTLGTGMITSDIYDIITNYVEHNNNKINNNRNLQNEQYISECYVHNIDKIHYSKDGTNGIIETQYNTSAYCNFIHGTYIFVRIPTGDKKYDIKIIGFYPYLCNGLITDHCNNDDNYFYNYSVKFLDTNDDDSKIKNKSDVEKDFKIRVIPFYSTYVRQIQTELEKTQQPLPSTVTRYICEFYVQQKYHDNLAIV